MADCIFCKIASGDAPSEFIKETDNFMVFNDLHPSAPVHILIVPKKHYPTIADLPDEQWVEAKNIALELAEDRNMDGFRLSNNFGTAAMINHVHIHFLSGIKKDRAV